MRFLTGAVGEGLRGLRHPLLGLMLQPGNRLASQVDDWSFHAADNGCFAQGDAFDPLGWLAWLRRVPTDRCLFATAPDVYGDAEATWARSWPFLEMVADNGHVPALVAQDGFDQHAVDCSMCCSSVGPWSGNTPSGLKRPARPEPGARPSTLGASPRGSGIGPGPGWPTPVTARS